MPHKHHLPNKAEFVRALLKSAWAVRAKIRAFERNLWAADPEEMKATLKECERIRKEFKKV